MRYLGAVCFWLSGAVAGFAIGQAVFSQPRPPPPVVWRGQWPSDMQLPPYGQKFTFIPVLPDGGMP